FAGRALAPAAPRHRSADRKRVASWKPAGVVRLPTAPDSIWSQIVSRDSRPRLRDPSRQTGSPVVLGIRAASLQPVAAQLGADLAAAQSATAFEVKPLRGAQLHVHARIEPVERNSAPNVVAILEGSDPTLKSEYVVFSAH